MATETYIKGIGLVCNCDGDTHRDDNNNTRCSLCDRILYTPQGRYNKKTDFSKFTAEQWELYDMIDWS